MILLIFYFILKIIVMAKFLRIFSSFMTVGPGPGFSKVLKLHFVEWESEKNSNRSIFIKKYVTALKSIDAID